MRNQFNNTHNKKPYDRPNNNNQPTTTFQQPVVVNNEFATHPEPLIGTARIISVVFTFCGQVVMSIEAAR